MPVEELSSRTAGAYFTGLLAARLGRRIVGAFDVRAPESEELVRLARCGEHRVLARGRRRRQANRHAPGARIRHLGRQSAHPHQLIETTFVRAELAVHIVGAAHVLAGGADRLVRLLRVLHLALVRTRGVG